MFRGPILLIAALLAASVARAEIDVVVLGETPVAEFTLPDGSTLKNAFVWRRSSEGLMIVHDDGQYFLNYELLPDDWKAAYLGAPAVKDEASAQPEFVINDPYQIMPTLESINELTPAGRGYLLREDADAESEKSALAVATLHALLTGQINDAKRFMLVIEEKGLEIEAVEMNALFVECATCDGEGVITKACATCSGSGECVKCEGEGLRKTGIGSSTIHCTACRGKGECAACGGMGDSRARCRVCSGRGKLLQKRYCEVKRDYFVFAANAAANQGEIASVMKTDVERVKKLMMAFPGLDRDAMRYYFSDAYEGSMDTNILAACVTYSLLKERVDEAERFLLMIKARYPDDDLLEIADYLNACDACDGAGRVERDCATCEGSGECPRCGGEGERAADFEGGRSIHCTTCRGLGKCSACGGDGAKTVRCSTCEGKGRIFEKERAKIKLDILVDELNDSYRTR